MRKRVLFVEDDPALLQVYVKLLEDEPDRWEVLVATDGWRALDLMEEVRKRCP